jgi:hypothetical protein
LMRKNLANKSFLVLLAHLLVTLAVALACSPAVVAQTQEDENKNAEPRTGAITGRVVNENGQPLPHAIVFASVSAGQPRTTATDDDGNFEISGLDALVYYVDAAAPSYVSTPREAGSLASYYRIGDAVTISLIRGGVITGSVTSLNGEPLVQVGVRAIMIKDANGKSSGQGRLVERPTDDRGIYRIYGLLPGTYLVSAGGRGVYGSTNAYDTDAPTYAPSSTRDTATEVAVRAGEETNVDIHHRGQTGHAVSGFVSGVSSDAYTNISLAQIVNGAAQPSAFSIQSVNSKGFAFYGVADGDYDLTAQSSFGLGETAAAEPRRISVKGVDLNGVELSVRTLGAISGRVTLENSPAPECKNKRQPLLTETLLLARRSETGKDQLTFSNGFAQGAPDKSGDFALRNLGAGHFSLNTKFFAKYWYLRSLVREIPGPATSRTPVNRRADLARAGINLKFGERISGVTVTLAAGAASLKGAVKVAEGETMPQRLYLHLAPAEKENADDPLRFFAVPVQPDGTFALNNLAPGRYWALARLASDDEKRAPDEAAERLNLRRAAEAAKSEVELKPCQNVVGYQLPIKVSALQK